MSQTQTSHRPQPAQPASPPGLVTLWIVGSALLWALYAVVFMQTLGEGPLAAAGHALANVLPITGLAVAVRAVLKSEVMRRSSRMQGVWHAGLAIAFAYAWYAMLIVLLAIFAHPSPQGLVVSGFSGPALTWQIFQGLILYAAIAAVCYAVRGGREAAQVTLVSAPATPPLTRYLIRKGDEMTPVAVGDIISITGAQDYSEVTTSDGHHLVSLSLADFEARLDPGAFVRVHRSAIINLGRLSRTEPAGGGRLLAHMSNGMTIRVSRAGAQALRRFLV